ncbi:hypothetical protein H2248_008413 [Termitomyces sp. 'cryptogamus']|nr:hypothetical protein H2248_008413 [Termitomyces sp. 'cryptogamus']
MATTNALPPRLPPRPARPRHPSPPLPPLPVDQSSLPLPLSGHPSSPSDPGISFPSYSIEVLPPPYSEVDEFPAFSVTYDDDYQASSDIARPRVHSMNGSTRPLGRTPSTIITSGDSIEMPFPEPQITARSASYIQPQQIRQRARSHMDSLPTLHVQPSSMSLASTVSSYNQDHDSDYEIVSDHSHEAEDLSRELSNLSMNSEEILRRFQAGELSEINQAWHRLVPAEAREALGEREVQRQSVIFEVFKAEREYVADLETIEDVIIKGLEDASPPVIPPEHLQIFIDQVFGNLNQVLSQHQRLLAELFARQREQHPLVQSVADIILDAVLKANFRSAYETYIKHYPLSESFHRNELKRNQAYNKFMEAISLDPRIRKRDLITFISRPVTRLPRLNLVLEKILKLTDKEHEHPDLEALPIILGILGDFIKSTQPGIEAAESKVKYWELCESLLYQKGEIIDMDLYDDSRTLVYSGPLSRLGRSESGWYAQMMELTGSLLDHYFVLTRDEIKVNGLIKRHLVSRPLSLFYLRLGSFTAPPEVQRTKSEDGNLLDSLRSTSVTVYPFTIYHASGKSSRRYTFYVASDGIRKRWYSAFVNTLGVYKARQDGNMLFYARSLTDRFFRVRGLHVAYGTDIRLSGRVTTAVSFVCGEKKFIAAGCQTGIYVSALGVEEFRRVFTHANPTGLAAIETLGSRVYNKFIIHVEGSLFSYSLDIVAQAALGKIQSSKEITDTMERVARYDSTVVFFKHLHIGERQFIMYTVKRRLQSSLDLHVVEVMHTGHPSVMSPQRTNSHSSRKNPSFKPFGELGYVPRDAYDISPLTKTVGICAEKGIIIVDPTNLRSRFLVVPDLSEASTVPSIHGLKVNLEDARPLGLVSLPGSVHSRDNEILVVFDLVGCYITRQGRPSRSAGFIKWETKATSFAHRGKHIFLFSSQFIEIRNITSGVIVQVIEGVDIRLLYPGRGNVESLVAMKGSKDDKDGTSVKIAVLEETTEIPVATPVSASPNAWDEWDM